MSRKLSQKHINAYLNGIFQKLFKGIKEDPELSLEIRKDDEAMVYYRKGKILTTGMRKEQPYIKMLDKQYYKDKKAPSVDIENLGNIGNITSIRRYFKEAKKLVYEYQKGREFETQQNITLGNSSFNNRYLVVDMEWQFSQAGVKPEDQIPKTRIDLIIVDTKLNVKGFNDIYLAELKVGIDSINGNSGILDHANKIYKIINNNRACNDLIKDVKTIINQKKELGLISGQHNDLNYALCPKMMFILAYRNETEKKIFEDEFGKVKCRANEQNMAEPMLILHNTLIELK